MALRRAEVPRVNDLLRRSRSRRRFGLTVDILTATLILTLLQASLSVASGADAVLVPPASARSKTPHSSSGAPDHLESPADPETLRMSARLAAIATNTSPMAVRFFAREQVAIYQREIQRNPKAAADPELRYNYATALLNSGRNLESFEELNRIEKLLAAQGKSLSNTQRVNLRLDQALAYLREGERINCLSNHTADSCLLPLQGGGIHRDKSPSRQAIEILHDVLKSFPENLAARWLLNIAHMTVGDYPGAVPEPWLIPPSSFASDIDFPRFRDIAPAAGLALNELSGGSAVEDFDSDGLLDVVVTSIGLSDPMHFFRNRGDGRFDDTSVASGLHRLTGGLNMVTADYDNDGDTDILVLRGAWMREEGRHPNSLLRNDGKGRFRDVTESAGLLSFHPTQTAAWLDFDGDGWLDLFIGNESVAGRQRHASELFRNRGDGTFTNIARASSVTIGAYVKGVAAGDFNNDGRPDLYVSILGGRNKLLRNDGPRPGTRDANEGWLFTDVAESAGVVEPIDSFPTWFFDYDNDGWQDLFVTGYKITHVGDIAADVLGLPGNGARARLYRNRGDGTFTNLTSSLKLDRILHAMGANFGDLDNDGWLDFYIGTGDPDLLTIIPNRMFRNAEGRFFQDVTTAGGFGHLQKGHGVSFADFDNDGDQDVFEDMGGAVSGDVYPNVLFENPGFGNAFVTLRLEGRKANRSAIGARVRIDVEENGTARSIHRVVSSGGSFGANPFRLEVGLGRAQRIVRADILWPGSGVRQVVTGLSPGNAYRILEGDADAVPMNLPRFRFPDPAPHAHHHDH